MIIGIVGGIASGKSTVTGIFNEYGCVSIDADQIAHEALVEKRVREDIRAEFGAEAFDVGGRIDRKKLAGLVFGDQERLEKLNTIVHPRVQNHIVDRVSAHRRTFEGSQFEEKQPESMAGRPPASVMILDVSLLATSPLVNECDAILFVDADLESRQPRCRDRGWGPDELAKREAHQATLEEKRALARWTVNNSGTLEATRKQIGGILEEIGVLTEST